MKRQFRIRLMLSLSLIAGLLTIPIQAQIGIDLSAGNAVSLHELSNTKLSPLDINSYTLNLSYLPKKRKVGLALQLSTNSIETNQDFLNQFQNLNTRAVFDKDKWKNNFLFVGPVLRLGSKKLSFDFFPKLGLGLIAPAERQLYYSELSTEYLLYEDKAKEQGLDGGQFMYGLDAKLNFSLTPNLGFHLSGGINTNQFVGQGTSVVYREVESDNGMITSENVVQGQLLEKICDAYNVLNVGVGITLNLGRKKDERNNIFTDPYTEVEERNPDQENSPCIQLTTISPQAHQEFRADAKARPTFSWTANTDKKLTYLFSLREIIPQQTEGAKTKLVYETKTTNRSLSWPSKVDWPSDLADNTSKDFTWSVEVIDSKEPLCNGQAQSNFSVSRSTWDVFPDSIVIDCRQPVAYDPQGNVCYDIAEYWTVTNSNNVAATFLSHTTNVGTATPAANSSIFTNVPANSTQSFNYNYSICVPLSTTTFYSKLEYHCSTCPPGFDIASDIHLDSLPPCLCDICDEWEIDLQNQKIEPWVNSNAGQDYIYIEDNLTAIAPAGNIIRVEAELVQYEHWKEWGSSQPDDPELNQCFTCNTKNGQHGTFVPYNDPLGNPTTNILSTGFINQDRAYYREAGSPIGPAPSRNIYWRAGTPAGVNMPLTSKLTIGVPNFSNLEDCCADEFKLCIRYTFTAYNPDTETCTVCSEVICYFVKRNNTTIIKKSDPQPTY